jgi:hypothetical protein
MKSSLFSDVTQSRLVVSYRRFVASYPSYLQVSKGPVYLLGLVDPWRSWKKKKNVWNQALIDADLANEMYQWQAIHCSLTKSFHSEQKKMTMNAVVFQKFGRGCPRFCTLTYQELPRLWNWARCDWKYKYYMIYRSFEWKEIEPLNNKAKELQSALLWLLSEDVSAKLV